MPSAHKTPRNAKVVDWRLQEASNVIRFQMLKNVGSRAMQK